MISVREVENKRVAKIQLLETMKFIMEHIAKEGPLSTWVIAAKLKLKTREARAIMIKMEKKDIVVRHMFSSKNNTVWKLAT